MNERAAQVGESCALVSEPVGRAGRRQWVRRLIYLCLTGGVLFFVGRMLIKTLSKTDWSQARADPLFLALGVLCLFLDRLVLGATLHLIISAFMHGHKLRSSVAVNWVASLGRYIPGKFASVGGTVILLARLGVQLPVAMGATFLFMGLTILVGIAVSAPLLLLESVRSAVPAAWLWCGIVLVGAMVCLHPRVFLWLTNLGLRWLRRQPIHTRYRDRYLLAAMGMAVGHFLSQGLTLWLIARALTPVAVGQCWLFVSAAAFASVAGLLAFFAPAGIGVREGIYVWVLGPVIGGGPAALVAVLLRVILAISDVGTGAVGTLILKSRLSPSRRKVE